MHCSQPGSSVYGILQARILEWVAIPFSRGSSQPRGLYLGRLFTIWATIGYVLFWFNLGWDNPLKNFHKFVGPQDSPTWALWASTGKQRATAPWPLQPPSNNMVKTVCWARVQALSQLGPALSSIIGWVCLTHFAKASLFCKLTHHLLCSWKLP